jgi:hypothetical protein
MLALGRDLVGSGSQWIGVTGVLGCWMTSPFVHNVIPFPGTHMSASTNVSVASVMNTSKGIDLCSKLLEDGFWTVQMPFRANGGGETSFMLHFEPKKVVFMRDSRGVQPFFELDIECRWMGTLECLYTVACSWSPVDGFRKDRVVLGKLTSLFDLYSKETGIVMPGSDSERMKIFSNGVDRHLNEGLRLLLGFKQVAGVGVTRPDAKDTFPEPVVDTEWSVLE